MHEAAFEFIERITDLDAVEAIIAAFRLAAGRFGFSTFALGELPKPRSARLPKFFVSIWPQDWVETYTGEKLAQSDACIAHARQGQLPAMWSELREFHRDDPAVAKIFDLTADHGWPDGLAIPVHGPRGYHGLVAIGGETDDLSARDRTALHLMGLYLHNRLRELIDPDDPAVEAPRLTEGEVECIHWLVEGKSDWEIGEILNIAESTAHWRIENAKRKFGVKTRAQLTALAVRNGVVTP